MWTIPFLSVYTFFPSRFKSQYNVDIVHLYKKEFGLMSIILYSKHINCSFKYCNSTSMFVTESNSTTTTTNEATKKLADADAAIMYKFPILKCFCWMTNGFITLNLTIVSFIFLLLLLFLSFSLPLPFVFFLVAQ